MLWKHGTFLFLWEEDKVILALLLSVGFIVVILLVFEWVHIHF